MSDNYPKLTKIKTGWAASGNGWAVHAPTQEEALKKYDERKRYYSELAKRPFLFERKAIEEKDTYSNS